MQYGWTPLHYASVNGHTDTVRALLTHPGVDVNAKDKVGTRENKNSSFEPDLGLFNDHMAWLTSAHKGQILSCRYVFPAALTARQPMLSPNSPLMQCDSSALMRATFKGFAEVVQVLLAHPGVDVNIKDNVREAWRG